MLFLFCLLTMLVRNAFLSVNSTHLWQSLVNADPSIIANVCGCVDPDDIRDLRFTLDPFLQLRNEFVTNSL
jgi:hypothetical protein